MQAIDALKTKERRADWEKYDLVNQKIAQIRHLVGVVEMAVFSELGGMQGCHRDHVGGTTKVILEELDELDSMI